MMGGGMLLRTVARAVASTGTSSVTSGASTGFCSSCKTHRSRPTNLRTSSSSPVSASASQQVNSTHQLELEDWELAGHEEGAEGRSRERVIFGTTASQEGGPEDEPREQCWHVFGLPPSLDEAKEAASELQMALELANVPASESLDSEIASSSSLTTEYGSPYIPAVSNHQYKASEEQSPTAVEWEEPQLVVSESGTVQVKRSRVYEAFQLFQNDSNVKGAVMSIVSDPDVWAAMMRNEKVQELKRIFEVSQGLGKDELEADSSKEASPVKHDWVGCISGVLHLIFGESKQIALQMKENILRIMSSMFSLLSKKSPPDDDDPRNNTMKSCMMLAVMVLAVVLIKRIKT